MLPVATQQLFTLYRLVSSPATQRHGKSGLFRACYGIILIDISERSIKRMSNEFFQAEGTLTITADMLDQMNDHGAGLKAELQRRLAEQKAAKRQTGDQQ